jgi:hypothetical protein
LNQYLLLIKTNFIFMKNLSILVALALSSNLFFTACKSEASKEESEALAAAGIPEGGFTSAEDVQKASQGMMDKFKNGMPDAGNETYEKIDCRLGGQIEVPNSKDWTREGNEWHNEKMDATVFIQDLAMSGDFTTKVNLTQITKSILEANKRDAPKFEDIKHMTEERGENVIVNFMGKFDNGTQYITKDIALTSKTKGSIAIMGRAKAQNAAYIMSLVEYMATSNLKYQNQ